MFKTVPIVALTAATVSIFYIPIWGPTRAFQFDGDLVVVLYLLTHADPVLLPGRLVLDVALRDDRRGAHADAAVRVRGAALHRHPLAGRARGYLVAVVDGGLLPGAPVPRVLPTCSSACRVALIALLGKLEKVPFDIPDAETEIVGGTFTEYSGKLLAFFRMAIDIEAVVASSLLAAVFLPWGIGPAGRRRSWASTSSRCWSSCSCSRWRGRSSRGCASSRWSSSAGSGSRPRRSLQLLVSIVLSGALR